MFNLALTLYDSSTVIAWLYNNCSPTWQEVIYSIGFVANAGKMVNYHTSKNNNSNKCLTHNLKKVQQLKYEV